MPEFVVIYGIIGEEAYEPFARRVVAQQLFAALLYAGRRRLQQREGEGDCRSQSVHVSNPCLGWLSVFSIASRKITKYFAI